MDILLSLWICELFEMYTDKHFGKLHFGKLHQCEFPFLYYFAKFLLQILSFDSFLLGKNYRCTVMSTKYKKM